MPISWQGSLLWSSNLPYFQNHSRKLYTAFHRVNKRIWLSSFSFSQSKQIMRMRRRKFREINDVISFKQIRSRAECRTARAQRITLNGNFPRINRRLSCNNIICKCLFIPTGSSSHVNAIGQHNVDCKHYIQIKIQTTFRITRAVGRTTCPDGTLHFSRIKSSLVSIWHAVGIYIYIFFLLFQSEKT